MLVYMYIIVYSIHSYYIVSIFYYWSYFYFQLYIWYPIYKERGYVCLHLHRGTPVEFIAYLGDPKIPRNSYGIPWYLHTPRGRSVLFPPPLRFLTVFEKFLRISRISSGVDHSAEFRSRALLDPEYKYRPLTSLILRMCRKRESQPTAPTGPTGSVAPGARRLLTRGKSYFPRSTAGQEDQSHEEPTHVINVTQRTSPCLPRSLGRKA